MSTDVVVRYQECLGARNFDAARSLLADDLRFKGPFEEFEDADSFVKTVQGVWNIVESTEIKHISSDGDEVVVLYDMITKSPAGTQLICEWYGVEDGKITRITAVFDTAPFGFLFEGR